MKNVFLYYGNEQRLRCYLGCVAFAFCIILLPSLSLSMERSARNRPPFVAVEDEKRGENFERQQLYDIASDWNSDDTLVTDLASGYAKPSLVSTPGGDLYVAVERLDDSGIALYKSTNNGQSWKNFFSWLDTGGDSHNPSIAYIETSSEKWVCVVFERVETNGTRTVEFFRINPENAADYDVSSVQSNINMASADDHIYPRIATDNIEKISAPNLYLTYALHGADYYRVYFAKSIDKGLNWSSPVNVTGNAENSSSPTQPDIAYGSSGLFITFTKLGWIKSSTSWDNQVFVTQSTNSGGDWVTPIQLTTDKYSKEHPRIAVSHGETSSVLIGYTLYWEGDPGDNTDVESYSSTDGGGSWDGPFLLPYTDFNERGVDLAVSLDQGYFYAAYWQEYSVVYTRASIGFPASWSSPLLVDGMNMASLTYARPSVSVNPTLALDEEAMVVWSDTRNAFDSVYFDSPFSPATGTFLPAMYHLLLLND